MTTMNMEDLVRLVEKAVKEDENENEERALEILTQLESTPIDSLDFTSPKFAACGKSINTLRKKAKSEEVKRKAKDCKDTWTKIIVAKSSSTNSKTPAEKTMDKTKTTTTTTTETANASVKDKNDENVEEN